ncbi:hypothetical protein MRB53_039393 [Persea americana]|nr:hypothetical protein MRB53_039393 [Persea americana]
MCQKAAQEDALSFITARTHIKSRLGTFHFAIRFVASFIVFRTPCSSVSPSCHNAFTSPASCPLISFSFFLSTSIEIDHLAMSDTYSWFKPGSRPKTPAEQDDGDILSTANRLTQDHSEFSERIARPNVRPPLSSFYNVTAPLEKDDYFQAEQWRTDRPFPFINRPDLDRMANCLFERLANHPGKAMPPELNTLAIELIENWRHMKRNEMKLEKMTKEAVDHSEEIKDRHFAALENWSHEKAALVVQIKGLQAALANRGLSIPASMSEVNVALAREVSQLRSALEQRNRDVAQQKSKTKTSSNAHQLASSADIYNHANGSTDTVLKIEPSQELSPEDDVEDTSANGASGTVPPPSSPSSTHSSPYRLDQVLKAYEPMITDSSKQPRGKHSFWPVTRKKSKKDESAVARPSQTDISLAQGRLAAILSNPELSGRTQPKPVPNTEPANKNWRRRFSFYAGDDEGSKTAEHAEPEAKAANKSAAGTIRPVSAELSRAPAVTSNVTAHPTDISVPTSPVLTRTTTASRLPRPRREVSSSSIATVIKHTPATSAGESERGSVSSATTVSSVASTDEGRFQDDMAHSEGSKKGQASAHREPTKTKPISIPSRHKTTGNPKEDR